MMMKESTCAVMRRAGDGPRRIDCEKFHNVANCCYLYANNEYRPKNEETMINDKVRMYLLPPLFNAAVRAGAAIMEVYKDRSSYEVSLKSDRTPITLADRLAHKTIREYLGPTRIPILSEEGRELRYEERRNWELFWLVDPLDGTVEFLKGNNEFTVNIALMENNVCVGAVIYVPYFAKMYVAGRGAGSFLKEGIVPDAAADYSYEQIVSDWQGVAAGRGGGGPGAPACGRVALASDARDARAHCGAAPAVSRPRGGRAGKFLQVLPAGRRGRRLLRPYVVYLRMGYGGRRADSRGGGR